MKHYEVVYLVNPDQSDQVPGLVERYTQLIKNGGGTVHRSEDWGRRPLAYPIEKHQKAHYLLMNIECDQKTLTELTTAFRYNDAIMRNLVTACKMAAVEPSILLKARDERARPDAITAEIVSEEVFIPATDVDGIEEIESEK